MYGGYCPRPTEVEAFGATESRKSEFRIVETSSSQPAVALFD